MRVLSFIELKEEYDQAHGLDLEDVNERNLLLIQFPNSVIVECDWLEFENLEKWTKENIDELPLNEIGYGKTGYDFGCFEYFFKSKINAEKFAAAIPKIYSSWSHSGKVYKSNGYENNILYDPVELNAIVYK